MGRYSGPQWTAERRTGQDWASHRIAPEMSGKYDVPMGPACPSYIRHGWSMYTVMTKTFYAVCGPGLGCGPGIRGGGLHLPGGIRRMREFSSSWTCPVPLRTLGFPAGPLLRRWRTKPHTATPTIPVGNFVKIGKITDDRYIPALYKEGLYTRA